jgi:DNA-binding response OmpR family regulator
MENDVLLLVDDDRDIHRAVTEWLAADNITVCACASASEALTQLETFKPTVILSDIVMPEVGGFAFRRAFERRFPDRNVPFLFMSSLGDMDTMHAVLDAGGDDFVVKPLDGNILRVRVRAALRRGGRHPSMFDGTRRVSEMKVGRSFLRIETQFVEGEVVTVVVGDGQVLSKTQTTPADPSPDAVMQVIQHQHEDARASVRDRVAVARMSARTSKEEADPQAGEHDDPSPPASEHPQRMCGDASVKGSAVASGDISGDDRALAEAGCEEYLAGNYAKALELLERALAMRPDNKILEQNVAILRRKIQSRSTS